MTTTPAPGGITDDDPRDRRLTVAIIAASNRSLRVDRSPVTETMRTTRYVIPTANTFAIGDHAVVLPRRSRLPF